MRFVLITRNDLAATNRLFEDACEGRRIPLVRIEAGNAAGATLAGPEPRLIYCAAADWASRLLEKLVARPGDALLHDPHFVCDHQPIRLRNAGIPMPNAVYVPAADADRLAQQVAWLGGFPVVVKRAGSEGGRGVSLARDLPDLTRQLAQRQTPVMLETYFAHHRAWRLSVLHGRVLAATAAAPAQGDFRSNTPDSVCLGAGEPPAEAVELSIAATGALKLDFGGADVLEGPDGELVLTEVNFPCYFADQQALTGVDIAGAVVDALADRMGELP